MTQRYILRKDNTRPNVLANAHAFLDRLPDTREFEIVVKRHVKRRTDKQRRSLFGVAYKAIMEAAGYQGDAEKRKLHENMCGDYFGWKDDPILGRVPERTTTTNEHGERDEISTLDALDMYYFIQRKAAEFGIDVPDPDPYWRAKAEMEARHGS